MPFGTFPLGSDALVHVGLTSSPTTPVGALVTWGYPSDRPTSRRDYYMMASSNTLGKMNVNPTLTVDYLKGDSGQQILFNAFISGVDVWIKVLLDGINGEQVKVKVSNRSPAGPGVNDYSTTDFNLVQQADPTLIGSGFGT